MRLFYFVILNNIVFFCFVPFSNKIWGNNFKTLGRVYEQGYNVVYEALCMDEWPVKESQRYIIIEWSLRGVVLGRCSSKLANLLKLLKITEKSFTNTCDGVQFCKVSCFQPAVLPEKRNPSQVFSKEFAWILKTRSKKFSINISQDKICVLPLLSNYYHCL